MSRMRSALLPFAFCEHRVRQAGVDLASCFSAPSVMMNSMQLSQKKCFRFARSQNLNFADLWHSGQC